MSKKKERKTRTNEQLLSFAILRPREAAKVLGISVSTLYRWSSSGVIPPQRRFTKRTVGWTLSDLRDFIQSKR